MSLVVTSGIMKQRRRLRLLFFMTTRLALPEMEGDINLMLILAQPRQNLLLKIGYWAHILAWKAYVYS
jgi:hypothetical protein